MTTHSLPSTALVRNADAVTALFGQFDLHDATLCTVRLAVARGGLPVLEADFVLPGELALATGTADRGRDYRITLRCTDVVDLALADFGDQNVVAEYAFESLDDRDTDDRRIHVAFTASPGCDFDLRCQSVAIAAVEPLERAAD